MSTHLSDEQAVPILLAAIHLAATVPDGDLSATTRAAEGVLHAADGDPIAALAITAALVQTSAPVDRWWQRRRGPSLARTMPIAARQIARAEAERLTLAGVDPHTVRAIVTDPNLSAARMRPA